MADWLLEASGARAGNKSSSPSRFRTGRSSKTLIERGFAVFAINPKQLDRFRDRFTMAGAKDDSRDAEVLASACAPIRERFRRLDRRSPHRRTARMVAHRRGTRRRATRLANRIREQLWRYYPPCSNSKPTSAPSGCSISSPSPRRPQRSAAARTKLAKLLKRATHSSSRRRDDPKPVRAPPRNSRREPSRPQAPTFSRSSHVCGCSTARSARPSEKSTRSSPAYRPARTQSRGRKAA